MQFLTLCGQPTNPKASFVYHQKFISIYSYSSPFSPSRHTNPDVYNMASSEYHKNTNKTGASLPPFCLYKVGQFPQTSFSKTTLPDNFVGGIKHFEGHSLCVQNRNYILRLLSHIGLFTIHSPHSSSTQLHKNMVSCTTPCPKKLLHSSSPRYS